MRFVPTRVHGVIDYIYALLLIGAPYVLDFSGGGAPQWAFWLLGFGVIGLALLTRFELGVIRLVPMPVHLGIDVLAGLLLAASPWLLGFADRVWAPHLVFGLLEAGLALVTRTAPEDQPARQAA
ncbi:SPW repeat domain-containing protein [Roseicella aerolata]|uniref:SPW repeat protein n=1 Tax=Roseicella aerolata TaxID=2883479 RepID=A0A9X1LD75_9PROT|nr:SPW repeat protein [Roseicella aerolata]MCB4824965.1 SPW repeat protein [Roseicella aerolata]